MATTSRTQFDDTGKVVFDNYYVQPDPRPYFTTDLADLGYRIPGEARPFFRQVIDALRRERDQDNLSVVDLGCSYGVNAALLKTDLKIEHLYAHYGDEAVAEFDHEQMLQHDMRFYAEHATDSNLAFIGIDTSEPAVRYATEAGLLSVGIAKNLEEEMLGGAERDAVSEADLVISTGAIGYVQERSIEQVLDAASDQRPWMAHCVLRMFSFEPYEKMLRERGYTVEQLDGTLRQRQFANPDERAHVMENLAELGVDPAGKEDDGWYHANVFVARPSDEASESITIG